MARGMTGMVRVALASAVVALAVASVFNVAVAAAASAEDVVDLTPETYETMVTDPSKDVLVAYTASWCGHCKALKPVFAELAKTFADEPDVVIAVVDADTHSAIGTKEGVKGFPTIKFWPRGANAAAVSYDAGRDLNSFVNYINTMVGTDVLPNGKVLPSAGIVDSLKDSVSSFLEAAASERDALKAAVEQRLSSLDARSRSYAQYYVKVMDRYKTQGEAWLTKEQARLSGLLESASPGSITDSQMRSMRRRLNVIDYFVRALGSDMSAAADDAADAAADAAAPVADAAADAAASAGELAAAAGKVVGEAAVDTLKALNPEKEL
ncbi:hypothetical protein MMPV_003304 [Pyropia vietnamensis]